MRPRASLAAGDAERGRRAEGRGVTGQGVAGREQNASRSSAATAPPRRRARGARGPTGLPLRGEAVPDEKLPSSERSLREFEWEAAMLIIVRPTTASMKPADFCCMKFSLKLIGVERSRAGLVMEDFSDVVGTRDTVDGAATMSGDALGIGGCWWRGSAAICRRCGWTTSRAQSPFAARGREAWAHSVERPSQEPQNGPCPLAREGASASSALTADSRTDSRIAKRSAPSRMSYSTKRRMSVVARAREPADDRGRRRRLRRSHADDGRARRQQLAADGGVRAQLEPLSQMQLEELALCGSRRGASPAAPACVHGLPFTP